MSPRRMRALWVADALLSPLALAGHLRRRKALPDAPRILVFEFWHIGDAVMVDPLLRALRVRFPRAEISLLCKPAARVLLEPSGIVDRFIEIDVPWTAFEGKYQWRRYTDSRFRTTIRALRHERFDVTLDSRMDLRSNVLAWIIGARRRVGFDVPGGRGLLTDRVADPGDGSHKVEDWLAMLQPMGGASAPPQPPVLAVEDSTQARVDAQLRDMGMTPETTLVAMHPSARQAVRRWSLDRFGEVASAIGAMPNTRVLVLVDPDGYGETLQTTGATCVRATLEELPAYLHRCAVFVGNDSGPAHIAAAVGATTVTIFGPGAIQWFRPYGPGQRVVCMTPMRCRPCFDHCTRSENFCLTTLPVDRVMTEVRRALASRANARPSGVDLTPVGGEILA